MEKDLNIVRAVSRAIAILRAINRKGSMTMMEIAKDVGLAYPTVCRIVETLVVDGVIERVVERELGRKRYRPTALVQTLSVGYQLEDQLAITSRRHITDLTKRFSWPVSVCSRVGMNMVIRESTHSFAPFTLNVYYPGYTLPLLACSSGKAYLAFCPDEERETILHGLRHYRGEDAENVSSIERLLDQIRERGFSAQEKLRHTANPGRTSALSAPIFKNDYLAGTLTLIYYASAMMTDEAAEQFGESLLDCAHKISADLGESGMDLPSRARPILQAEARV